MHARDRIIYYAGLGIGSASRSARVGAGVAPRGAARRRPTFYAWGRAPPRAGVRGCARSRPRCALAAWWRAKIRPELSEGPLQCARERRAGSPQWLPHGRRRFFDLILSYHRALSWLHIYMLCASRFCKFRSTGLFIPVAEPLRLLLQLLADKKSQKHPAARSREHISQGHLRAPFAKGEGWDGILRSFANRMQIALF